MAERIPTTPPKRLVLTASPALTFRGDAQKVAPVPSPALAFHGGAQRAVPPELRKSVSADMGKPVPTKQVKSILGSVLTDWNSSINTGCSADTVALTPNVASPANAAITPLGTGNFVLAIPTPSSAVGGNCRGENAVDLQLVRASATQVASGNRSAIVAGSNNTASAADSLAAGVGNLASGVAAVALGEETVAAGEASLSTGIRTVAVGVGSFAHGTAPGPNQILAIADGSQVGGVALNGSTIFVPAAGTGSHAFGLSDAATNPGEISVGEASGALAHGYSTGGIIVASDFGHGGVASGQANDTPGGGIQIFAAGAEARGYVSDPNSIVYAAGLGGKAFGTAVEGGILGVEDSSGGFAHGASVGGTIFVFNDAPGAEAAGLVSADSQITVESIAAKALGSATEGVIEATAEAAFARGTVIQGVLQASAVAASASGFAADGGAIAAQGTGSEASGFVNGQDGNGNGGIILATGEGSKAHGLSINGGSIVASGNGASASGVSDGPVQAVQASADNSLARGPGAAARQFGVHSYSGGTFSSSGDAQTLEFRLRAVTSGGGAANLTLDGSTLPRLDQFSCAWTYWLQVVGISTDDISRVHAEVLQGAARQDAVGDGFIVAGPARTSMSNANGSSVTNPSIPASSSDFVIQVVSGSAPSANMRWYATLIISQVGAPLTPELLTARRILPSVAVTPRRDAKNAIRKIIALKKANQMISPKTSPKRVPESEKQKQQVIQLSRRPVPAAATRKAAVVKKTSTGK